MNTQRRCGCMSKITENLLNIAVFAHMEPYNRSNVAPTESYKMSEHISPTAIRAPIHLQTYLKDYLKIFIQTHYITFQDVDLQPYFKIACVKSVLWPALISNRLSMFQCPVEVWVFEQHAIILSATVRFPTVSQFVLNIRVTYRRAEWAIFLWIFHLGAYWPNTMESVPPINSARMESLL